MFDFNTCTSQWASSEAGIQAAVELMLPERKNPKYAVEDTANRNRLADISSKYGVQWIPVPEFMLLIRKRTERSELKKVQLPPALIEFWHQVPEAEQPALFGARVDYHKGVRVLLPCPRMKVLGLRKGRDWECEEWDSLLQIEKYKEDKGEEGLDSFLEELFSFEEDGVYCDEAGSWWMAWLFPQLEKVPPEAFLDVMQILRPIQNITNGEDVVFSIKNKMMEFQFWLKSRTVLSNTGSEHRLMERCSINGEGYSALPLFFVLGVLFGGKYEGSIPAFLNDLPNAWERDEGSYGVKPEEDHPSGVVNSDLRLPLAGRVRDWDKGNMRMLSFPWVIPLNGKFTPTMLAQTIKSEGASAPDKYNMKSATGRLGCMALGMAMNQEKGLVWTIHDASKPNKWLNRPTQARLFNFLMSSILREDGTVEERCRGNMENTVSE
jgi:hypothetical protein